MRAAAVFSDNMVLQRRRPVRIFGTCARHQGDITVSIPELDVSAKALISGKKWEAVLPPMEAVESCTLELISGAVRKKFVNVAVGEVWLAGGQSNMEFELQNELNGSKALAECKDENVRFYYTPKCEMLNEKLLSSERNTCWGLPSEEGARAWSAVGYYFAKELSRRLGVTVGVIGCNWGGTSASAWIPREALERDSRIRPYIDEYDKAIEGKSPEEMIAEYEEYGRYQWGWQQRQQQLCDERPDVSWAEILEICGENRFPGPAGIMNPMRPCGLHETMISRIAPYTLGGVIYYQGESDDTRPDTYEVLMKALIDQWRRDWKDNELPFLMVQLPMHRYANEPDTKSWPVIREAQMNVFRTVKNTGLAVALDCGEFDEIHPKEKAVIAHRLYLQALSEVYGLAGREDTLSPLFSYAVNGNGRIRLYFDNCSGFEATGEINGFEVSGADGRLVPAEAEIDGNTIILRADIEAPLTEVRYKWTNYADVELYGKNGLPVPTFRKK